MSTQSSKNTSILLVEGRRVIVTGGTVGIGFALAQALVEHGAHVLITGRTEERISKAVADLTRKVAHGGRVLGFVADVTKREDNERLVATAVREFGGLDALVNNAGTATFKPFGAYQDDEVRALFELNVFGLFALTQLALPEITKSSAGRIVNISSGVAIRGTPGATPYSATKGAVSALGRSLAIELAADPATRHITVNTILPGPFESELFNAVPREVTGPIVDAIPLKRAGEPHNDLGGLLITLISNAGSYITGQDLAVDGGLTARA